MQTYFAARWLTQLKNRLREDANIIMDEIALLNVLGTVIGFYVCIGEHRQFVSNSLLVIVPLILMLEFPAENPSNNLVVIYWWVNLTGLILFCQMLIAGVCTPF